jgi:hypothetical protein
MWKSQRLELFMCIHIIYACSLQKTNTTIRVILRTMQQTTKWGGCTLVPRHKSNKHAWQHNTKQISSRMVTDMVEHGLLLVPFMNECKTRGMYPYVQLLNSPKTMKSESNHVWKLLYCTSYIIDVCVCLCVWPLKIQHIGLSRHYYVCNKKQPQSDGLFGPNILK